MIKSGPRLEKAQAKLEELRDRYSRIGVADSSMWTNQTLSYAKAVGDMLVLADAMLRGGVERTESRGSHYREDYPERDDERFLKTTIAEYDPQTRRASISFEDVEIGMVEPRKRTYGKIEASKAEKGAAKPEAAPAAN